MNNISPTVSPRLKCDGVAREAIVPLSGAAMDLTFAGPITMSTRGYGDTEVVIEIVPTPEHPMMLDEIAVQFPGGDDEWPSVCAAIPKQARHLGACSGCG